MTINFALSYHLLAFLSSTHDLTQRLGAQAHLLTNEYFEDTQSTYLSPYLVSKIIPSSFPIQTLDLQLHIAFHTNVLVSLLTKINVNYYTIWKNMISCIHNYENSLFYKTIRVSYKGKKKSYYTV